MVKLHTALPAETLLYLLVSEKTSSHLGYLYTLDDGFAQP